MSLLEFLILALLIASGFGFLLLFLTRQQRRGEPPFLLIQKQLDTLRSDFLANMEQSRQGLDKRLDNAGRVFTSLESRMVRVEEVTRQVLEVGKDIAGLQQILKAPKLRGNFSEQLLSDLLSQMMPRENFSLQHLFQSGERVDAVIQTSQGMVPIDAKFPLENFQRYLLVEKEEEKRGIRKLFLSDVKKHINDIASKYILPSEGTFEFALMYIPAENVYYEIITRDLAEDQTQSIMNHALRKKVIPVSPNTFYAYLQTILLGLRGMQVEKRVREIVAELGRLKIELGGLRGDFSLLGKHLSHSLASFEKSDRRLSRLDDKLQAMETLPREKTLTPSQEKSLAEPPPVSQ